MDQTTLKGNLEWLKQLNKEEADLNREFDKLSQRLGGVRTKRDNLKALLYQEVRDARIEWAIKEFDAIFNPTATADSNEKVSASNGHQANKTHLVLKIIRDNPNLRPKASYALAKKHNISEKYYHNTLGVLRKKGLIGKNDDSEYVATAAGKAMELDI